MSIDSKKKVRYAVVGLGHIAQAAVLPAFDHARENSELAALVSGDPLKLKTLGDRYGVKHRWSYEQFDEGLRSGEIDAVYIALPNDMHKEYAVRAANAGIHILVEKPMALSEEECWEMIDAASANNVKLMVAYRLHFEEANLSAVELIRSGAIGDPRIFSSTFSMHVRPGNIRTDKRHGGGPLYDLGVYCINAARYLFRDEPTEVIATTGTACDERFKYVEEAASAIMRFPGDRLAQFTCSFGAVSAGQYRVFGTKGDIALNPAFDYELELAYELNVEGKKQRKTFEKRDQFAAELIQFSECVTQDIEPEPSGEEGLIDVRIIEAMQKSCLEYRPIRLLPFEKRMRPSREQEIKKPPVRQPELIHVQPPSIEPSALTA